jgi:hypothetical protein
VKPTITFVVAALLAAAALMPPLWGFAMSAPQYPDETLHLQIARTGIVGDVHEVTTLQHYIGVRFPSALPELQWAVWGIVGLAVLLLLAAFVGNSSLGHLYRLSCAAAALIFLLAAAVAVQARLYQVGHDRDRSAPIRAVHDFTPPLIGPVKVGNFTVWSFPHVGGLLLVLTATLSVVGSRKAVA